MSGEFLTDFRAALQAYESEHLQRALNQLDRQLEHLDQDVLERLNQQQDAEGWALTWYGSQFAADFLGKFPQLWLETMQQHAVSGGCDKALAERINQDVVRSENEILFQQSLRRIRHRESAGIIYREFTRQVTLAQSAAAISALAESLCEVALQWVEARQPEHYGKPQYADGRPMRLVVLAMGKLGGRELNLSSDIDLMFCFPESGETQGGKRQQDHQTYFTRIGQQLIKALDLNTADGQVFRVDMRLRPWGQSGPLVQSFDAMELYYQTHGRDWERYAMIKARPIAGDIEAGEALMTTLRPFVYRRYIDFSVIESLREMKRMIRQQVQKKGMDKDLKLGRGGIREIEFICQVFQLIFGGRDPGLQSRSLFETLKRLLRRNHFPRSDIDAFAEAYGFLRFAEHAVQAWNNEQTQALPASEVAQLRLARVMGYDSTEAFFEALSGHRTFVEQQFEQLIEPIAEADENDCDKKDFERIWSSEDKVFPEGIFEGDDSHREALSTLLKRFAASHAYTRLEGSGRNRVDQFVPMMLRELSEVEQPERLLERMLELVSSVSRRTAYLVLLLENPSALSRLMKVVEASGWFLNQLVQHPAHLDEFLTDGEFTPPLTREAVDQEWLEFVDHHDISDTENFLERLAQFYRGITLRVIAAEVEDSIKVMQVSDALTWLAEHVLQCAYDHVIEQMKPRYGQLKNQDGSPVHMLVIGYGKLGGIELGHTSDLDLVFIHDGKKGAQSDGDHPLDVNTFTGRVVQRIISLLSTPSTWGRLYEIDLRLRPDGNQGLLVNSLEAYEKYLRTKAWTWELQSLVRTRGVAGDKTELLEPFETMRQAVLCSDIKGETLLEDVKSMRQKMRQHLAGETTNSLPTDWLCRDKFALKHDRGGIVDIEFLVQYLVLRNAHRYPELVTHSDNIRLLDALAETGLMQAEEVAFLQQTYRAYRVETHRLGLNLDKSVVDAARFLPMREQVMALWQKYLEADSAQ